MFEGLRPTQQERLCLVGEKMAELSGEDLKILEEALSDPCWSTNALCDEVNKRGFRIGYTALNRHRKEICLCSRN